MQPCSREMQGINSLLNSPAQISLQDLHHHQIQNQNQPPMHHFDSAATGAAHDDFLEQMLSSCSWPPDLKSPWDPKSDDNNNNNSDSTTNAPNFHFDESAILASKLRHHQISSNTSPKMLLQHHLPSLPLSLTTAADYDVDASSFKSPNQGGGDGSVQALYNGFAGSLQAPNQPQHFHHPQQQSFGAPMNQSAASGSTGGGAAPAQPRQRVRARRGQATDPHSIAERLRRERIAERMKALQELVPNANKTDKASMLDEIIDYVKFLQLQVKVLSMSRLGGAAAVAPLVADISSEGGGGGDCVQAAANGGGDSLTVTEHQVAKLMEEDMGSAMQYLQGKGLCLMPISLATAISTSTCHSGRMPTPNAILAGEGPTSPSMSVLTVQSATVAADANAKDAASVSKP